MIKFKFTTLTPLHISSGEELGFGLDYVIRWNMFCKVDFVKLAEKLAGKNIFNFSENYSIREIVNVINKNKRLFEKQDYSYRLTIRKDFYELVNNPRAEGQKYVKEFINSNNRFYIPASSIKGALLTILGIERLGIDPNNAHIEDKFVFRDSDFIPYENFCLMLTTNRPPKTCLICLKKDVEFDMYVMKNGKLNLDTLRVKLSNYSSKQIELAKSKIQKFKSQTSTPKGADIFYEALENISNVSLSNDEYLINIGFGGGSWFKVFEGEEPKFKSKSPRRKGQFEEAHTSVSFKMNNEINHIGWCKFKIEE